MSRRLLSLAKTIKFGTINAFRIIAGYTTSHLLRLIQLWQNFQETALSLERISDILDTPTEVEQAGKNNIPMPEISGAVKYENVSFRFADSGEKQLANINLEVSPGTFVGVVGSSGAGKSTLLMMDAGTIAEVGTHEQLMALRGCYYCLYQQQEASSN